MNTIPILYISGYNRSGTTLLMRLLSRIEGFVAVGELWHVWNVSFGSNELCGCGKPFRQCEFWNAVATEAFGGMDRVNAAEMQTLWRATQNAAAIPALLFKPLRAREFQNQLHAYTSHVAALYAAIQKISHARVIVDSSKAARYALALQEIPNIDLRVAHLVRDSRAVAYSWLRKKIKPDVHWKQAYMEQYSPLKSAREWALANTLSQSLAALRDKYTVVRYEDLVREPRHVLTQILNALDLTADLQWLDAPISFGIDHTMSGNPNRFQQGIVKLKPDDEWRAQMAASHKSLVTALTLPWLWRYGYLRAANSNRQASNVKRHARA